VIMAIDHTRDFFLAGAQLVHDAPARSRGAMPDSIDPPELHAVRLSDGAEIWVESYRDTRFRPPLLRTLRP